VPTRVSPIEKIRGEIDALFDGSRELSEVIEDVARLGARLIIQTAVEAEVDVFLGRARYQRAAECPDARAGSQDSGHGVGVQPVVLCCDLRFVGVSLRGSYPILLDNR